MRKILLTNLFSSILLFAFSQHTLDKEFVVTSHGDTLYGAVSISKRKFTEVKFDDTSGQQKAYKSDDILSFYDKAWGLYIVEKVNFDITRPLATKPRYSEQTNVFLKVIYKINGISIYYFINSYYGERYFIRKEGAPIEELISHKKIIEKNNVSYRVSDNLEKKILGKYLADCIGIQEEINKIELSEEGLTKLFIKYAACRSEKIPQYETKLEMIDKGNWSFGILGGGFLSEYYYPNGGPSVTPLPSNSGFNFGISTNYLASKRNKRISIINELTYKKVETSSNLVNWGDTASYKYDLDYLRVNSLFRYNFNPLKYLKPYLMIGISNSFVIANNSYQTPNLYLGYPQRKIKLQTYEQGFILGAGVNYKKVDLYAKFEVSNGWDAHETNDVSIWVHTNYFGIVYYFY